MNMRREIESLGILQVFGDRLKSVLLKNNKKLEGNSLLITLVRITKNDASRLINEAAVNQLNISPEQIKLLLARGHIRESRSKHDEYILTAKGVWEIDTHFGVGIDDFLVYLQAKHLGSPVENRTLSDHEKVILFCMLGARAFSESSAVDLKLSGARENLLEMIEGSQDFLKSLGAIDKDGGVSIKPKRDEHPVDYAMRRLNDLPQKTRHIYVSTKTQKYYLDVSEQNEITTDKLVYVCKKIFRAISSLSEVEMIVSFCQKLTYEKSKYIKRDTFFTDLRFDEHIRSAVQSAYIDQA